MAQPRRVLTGTLSTILAQMAVAILSLGYTAVTARIVGPESFGDFAIALSSMGLIALILSTGVPSQILRSAELDSSTVTRMRVMNLALGISGSLIFLLIGPLVNTALGAGGGNKYVWLLMLNLLLAPSAASEAALLRREGRNIADATVLFTGNAVGSLAAAAAIFAFRYPELLALPIVVLAFTTLLLSGVLRQVRYPFRWSRSAEFGKFAAIVTWQNLVFYVINALPTWFASLFSGVGALGQLTRASTLSIAPAASLTSALTRGLQGHWRHLTPREREATAICDVVVAVFYASAVGFGVLAVVSHDLINLWLGPGWELASKIGLILAVSCIFQVPYGVLSNALEMVACFSAVRWSQIGMLTFLGPLAVVVYTGNILYAAGAILLAQFAGLVSIVGSSAIHSKLLRRRLAFQMSRTFAVALLPIGLCVIATSLLSVSRVGVPAMIHILVPAIVGLTAGTFAIRATPVWGVITERLRHERKTTGKGPKSGN